MPALRKKANPQEIGDKAFRQAIARSKIEKGVSKAEVIALSGIPVTTWYRLEDKPAEITVGKLRTLYEQKLINVDDVIKMVTCGQ